MPSAARSTWSTATTTPSPTRASAARSCSSTSATPIARTSAPTTLNDVAIALGKLGPAADKLAPLFITVDPARDTPAVIGQYTAAFSPRIEGLTGSADQIKAVADEYRVYYAKHVTGPGPGDYTMDHSSILYVMRPNGRFAGIIRAEESPDAIAADLKKYVS